jgi:putative ABC transport system permease protein
MFKNYFKLAFRNLKKYKGYSFINLAGLAIGIACCILILLYVQDEFSYDRYAQEYDRIYRMVLDITTPDGEDISLARTPPPWAPALAQDYPAVENYVRFKTPLVSWLVSNEERDKKFHEKGFYFADETVFDFFDFKLLQGSPETALKDPLTLVLTESTAIRYFGDEDPLGKILRLDNAYDLEITGVMQDVPRNSHFDFDILASIHTLSSLPIYNDTNYLTWRSAMLPDLYSYLKLRDGYTIADLESKMPEFLEHYLGEILNRANISVQPHFQAVTSIHLHSNLDMEIRANSDVSYIYIFSAIALFVLVIACINFMNLATARSASRAQEVGMRKVVGAERRQLIWQFLGESIVLAFMSLLLAVALVVTVLPFFNAVSGKSLGIEAVSWSLILGILGLTALAGILAGSYPAVFLSSFQPVAVFRGALKAGRSNTRLRKFLVVFQFALSLIFIIGTAVVYNQLRYIQNKHLGFSKEQVVVLPMGDPLARDIYQTFKDRVLQEPDVLALSGASSVPGGLIGVNLLLPEGASQGNEITLDAFLGDHDFIEALGLEMVEGRAFSREFSTDTMQAFILNETAIRRLGWEGQAVNKRISMGNFKRGRVVGVVKDFHAKSLHQRIEPLVIHIAPDPDAFHWLAVKISTQNIDRALASIQTAWEEIYPHDPFTFTFLDADFGRLYHSDRQRGQIFLTFSILAVAIACLGLLGLASFTAEQKTKEIGIRKVLGATIPGIIRLLSTEFVKLVLLANLIAWPVAYLVMNNWLQNFAYRDNIPLAAFPIAGFLSVFIALVTVSFQAAKAAMTDPVDSIRKE